MSTPDFLPHNSNPNASGPALHAVPGGPRLTEVKEEGIFASLWSSLRDTFFPEKLPPLVLESKPVAVPDLMATKMSKSSIAASVAFYGLVILLIAFLVRQHVEVIAHHVQTLTQLTVPPPPPVLPKAERIGGGGGHHDLAPVSKGRLPKLAQQQIVPPKAPPPDAPKLAVEPTVVVQKNLQLANNTMPNLGMPNSNLPGVSLGNGSGTGVGSGNGPGIGPGSGGNIGGGFMHIGGSVRPPQVIYQVDPEFSEEARKAKFSGNVEVYLIVDKNGNPTHVRCVRDVGMGLGEKAVEAVRQYRFKPATQNGKPVAVDMYIDVNFQIF